MAEAASLLRDRNFVKDPGKSPAPDEDAAFGFFIRACIYKWCENLVPLGSAVPLYRILEKQNRLTMARIRKKFDSSATGFAFQGFSQTPQNSDDAIRQPKRHDNEHRTEKKQPVVGK
jgi:hypothetical protein